MFMPKIKIREIDKTSNEKEFENEIGVFVPMADSEFSVPTLVTDSANSSTFVKKAVSLGAKVYVCDTYAHAAEYLGDRNQFDIKFLLVSEATIEDQTDLESALSIAEKRKDCVVVLNTEGTKFKTETQSLLEEPLTYTAESFYTAENAGRGGVKGKYVIALNGKDLTPLKANEGYVLAYLQSIANGNPSWLAIAGKSRGEVPGMETAGKLTENEIDTMQSRTEGIAINPVCNMNPWGIRIWGNRTCVPNTEEDLVAISFANVRMLICDLKKALYSAAKENQFEQNSDVLWINFKSKVNVLLEQMVQSYGIVGYKWIKEETNGERAKLKACLRIIPVEAVEDFDLTIELNDSLEIAE